eukprot:8462356-Pyramimonas_sp.AAC.1
MHTSEAEPARGGAQGPRLQRCAPAPRGDVAAPQCRTLPARRAPPVVRLPEQVDQHRRERL